MTIRSISQFVTKPTNEYKKLRDISHEIKRIKAQTQYIRKHHVAPRTLSFNPSEKSYALKKLNII